jgi:hypothetical protein
MIEVEGDVSADKRSDRKSDRRKGWVWGQDVNIRRLQPILGVDGANSEKAGSASTCLEFAMRYQ